MSDLLCYYPNLPIIPDTVQKGGLFSIFIKIYVPLSKFYFCEKDTNKNVSKTNEIPLVKVTCSFDM